MTCKEKQLEMKVLAEKLLLKFTAGSSPDKVEGLILLLILGNEILRKEVSWFNPTAGN